MPSFFAKLEIDTFKPVLDTFILDINQDIDSLGRPASPVFGGTITVSFSTPTDPLITKWMFSPSKQMSGKIIIREMEGHTKKEIAFTNAFCVGMDESFDGTDDSTKMTTSIVISPEKIDVGMMKHDNNWPPTEAT